MEYIDENLNLVVQNQDKILYIRERQIGSKRALFAVMKLSEGVYKDIQITEKESILTFPFEPIHWFYNGPGYFLLKDYISSYNKIAINKNKLVGFATRSKENDKKNNIRIYAVFNDGSSTYFRLEQAKNFKKHGGINYYNGSIRSADNANPLLENYYIIEHYKNNDNMYLIPELQNLEKDKPKVKKL